MPRLRKEFLDGLSEPQDDDKNKKSVRLLQTKGGTGSKESVSYSTRKDFKLGTLDPAYPDPAHPQNIKNLSADKDGRREVDWNLRRGENPDMDRTMALKLRQEGGVPISPDDQAFYQKQMATLESEKDRWSGPVKGGGQNFKDKMNINFQAPDAGDKYRPTHSTSSGRESSVNKALSKNVGTVEFKDLGVPQWQENTASNPGGGSEGYTNTLGKKLAAILAENPGIEGQIKQNAETNRMYDLGGEKSKFNAGNNGYNPQTGEYNFSGLDYPMAGVQQGENPYEIANRSQMSNKGMPPMSENLGATKTLNTGLQPNVKRVGDKPYYEAVQKRPTDIPQSQVDRLENRQLNVLKNLLSQDIKVWERSNGVPGYDQGAKVNLTPEEEDNSLAGINKWRQSRQMQPIDQSTYDAGNQERKKKYGVK